MFYVRVRAYDTFVTGTLSATKTKIQTRIYKGRATVFTIAFEASTEYILKTVDTQEGKKNQFQNTKLQMIFLPPFCSPARICC